MEKKINNEGKPKARKRLLTCGTLFLIGLGLTAVGFGVGWVMISKEHREAASLPLNAVDFDALSDGVYHGSYAGGMYAWRVNECDVTVVNGLVTDIQTISIEDPEGANTDVDMLYERVIDAQSLQVDTISGATLTSNAYLQCVENALIPAQN
jgi:uncharacterized protein with FMN-binding domain